MPHSYERSIVVIAVIPHQNDPELHITDTEGNYPALTHEPGKTHEKTFHRIGAEILGGVVLSIDRRLAHLEDTSNIIYRAKPVAINPQPGSGLQWSMRE